MKRYQFPTLQWAGTSSSHGGLAVRAPHQLGPLDRYPAENQYLRPSLIFTRVKKRDIIQRVHSHAVNTWPRHLCNINTSIIKMSPAIWSKLTLKYWALQPERESERERERESATHDFYSCGFDLWYSRDYFEANFATGCQVSLAGPYLLFIITVTPKRVEAKQIRNLKKLGFCTSNPEAPQLTDLAFGLNGDMWPIHIAMMSEWDTYLTPLYIFRGHILEKKKKSDSTLLHASFHSVRHCSA